MLDFCDFIQVYVFATNHHLKMLYILGFGKKLKKSYYRYLEPLVCFSVFFCSFCNIPLLHQSSPLITEVKNVFGDPGLFLATFLPKDQSLL